MKIGQGKIMKLESLVVSLEMAKMLQAAGFEFSESGFVWVEYPPEIALRNWKNALIENDCGFYVTGRDGYFKSFVIYDSENHRVANQRPPITFPAPMLEELLERIPDVQLVKNCDNHWSAFSGENVVSAEQAIVAAAVLLLKIKDTIK